MKKTVLSAALASVMAASTALAETQVPPAPIQLGLGGYVTWYGAYVNQKRDTLVASELGTPFPIGKYNNFDVIGNAEIYFSGKARLNNGIVVGAMVQLEAGTDPSTASKTIDESYMTVDSSLGRIIIGNVKNVAYQMSVTAPDFSTIGLQDSDYNQLIIPPDGFTMHSATYPLFDDISTKISYITPTFAGFTAGVSFLPGNSTKGQDNNNLLFPTDSVPLNRKFKDGLVAVGLYEQNFGAFNIASSVSFTTYKPFVATFEDNGGNISLLREKTKSVKEYAAGLNIGSGNWNFGGSYRYVDAPKSSVAVLDNDLNGYAWDAGISYSFGPVETSLNYFHSSKSNYAFDGDDEYNLYQLAGNYQLGAGVGTFVNVGYVEYESADKSRGKSNEGLAVSTGFNLSF